MLTYNTGISWCRLGVVGLFRSRRCAGWQRGCALVVSHKHSKIGN
jgi:hypothetical protein